MRTTAVKVDIIDSGYAIALTINKAGRRTHIISCYLKNRDHENTIRAIQRYIQKTPPMDDLIIAGDFNFGTMTEGTRREWEEIMNGGGIERTLNNKEPTFITKDKQSHLDNIYIRMGTVNQHGASIHGHITFVRHWHPARHCHCQY